MCPCQMQHCLNPIQCLHHRIYGNEKCSAVVNSCCPSCRTQGLQCLGSPGVISHQLFLYINEQAMSFGGTFHEHVELLNEIKKLREGVFLQHINYNKVHMMGIAMHEISLVCFMIACTSLYIPDMAAQPSYPCPLMLLTSRL